MMSIKDRLKDVSNDDASLILRALMVAYDKYLAEEDHLAVVLRKRILDLLSELGARHVINIGNASIWQDADGHGYWNSKTEPNEQFNGVMIRFCKDGEPL